MPSAIADQILDYVRKQETFLVELLRELVEAESPSSHPAVHRHVGI